MGVSQETITRHRTLRKIRNNLVSFSFVLPFLFFSAIFSIYPIIRVLLLSFQKGSVLSNQVDWIGFQNYLSVFTDKQYYGAFINNLWYLILMIPFEQVMAFTIAMLLRNKSRLNAIFETVNILPMLISMVAAGIIISYVLSQSGPVNYLLSIFGIKEVSWLGHPFLAKLSVVILEWWKGLTFYAFIYMAALRAVPREYLEASEIDGAKLFRKIFNIILPLVKNTITLCVIMTTIWTFQVFDSVYVLTGGGPLKASESIIFCVYKATFLLNKIGIGAALSIVFMLIILLVSYIQMRLLRSDYEY